MSEKTRLQLDPGAPRRKASSGCRYLFWIGFLLGALVILLGALVIIGWILYFIGSSLFMFVSNRRFPHRALYQNTRLLGSHPDSVVRPLIDAQQTFDIAVSVWVRATEEEEDEHRRSIRKEGQQEKKEKEEKVLVPARVNTGNGKVWVTLSEKNWMGDEDILETPLYSDIAFRGLRLSDKGISTAIKFRLPTARFLGVNLSVHDLRASFVLIPSSPSPIDHLKNYSSWLSDSIKSLPHRAWPFPLGSPEHGNRTLADEALESFGFSIPLIEFREIQSRCSNSTGEKDSDDGDGKVEQATEAKVRDNDDGDNDDSEEEDDTLNLDAQVKGSESDKRYMTPAHKHHPHVVTRTQLRVADETNLFNRKAYNKAHRALKARSCGQRANVQPNRDLCWRNYHENGNWETRLRLEMPKPGNETETEVHWAYAPYLDTREHGAGPLDLIAVPVSRENCSTSADDPEASSKVASLLPNPEDRKFMDITWHISFSGRSAGKLAFADMFSWPYHVKHNASEWEKTSMHDAAELHSGFHGHWFHDDAHPRRRLLAIVLSQVCKVLFHILNIHYWYTRFSTVSISISGTAFLVLSSILRTLVMIASAAYDENHSSNKPPLIFLLLDVFTDLLLPFMMIKAITRAEFSWWKGMTWIPIARRAVATHKERASMRLDARTSWRTKGGVFLSLVGIYYFLTPHRYFVIPSLVPSPTSHDVPESKIHDFSEVLIPLEFTSLVVQLLLNHRSRTFAGWYKSSVVVSLMLQVMTLANFVPAVLGRIDARPGLSAHQVVLLVFLMAAAWQALTLRSVPQTGGDEDEE